MVAVSVLVPVADDVEQVKRLVRSLDRQTLPSADFEVVLRTEVERLATLAAHRPNVRVVPDGEPAEDLLTVAQGDFVLAVPQDETLFPESLARLRDAAARTGADGVVARVVTPGAPPPAALWADTDETTDHEGGAGRLFVRRDVAVWAGHRLEPGPTARVGVLGRYAVSRREGAPVVEGGSPTAQVVVDELGWRGDALHLALRVPGPAEAEQAAVELRHADTDETFLVPAATTRDDSGADTRLTAAIAPARTPDAGHPLADGIWHVGVLLGGADGTATAAPVPWTPCPPALVGGTGVVPAPGPAAGGARTLTLDVGPTTQPLLSNLDPAEGTVTESVVGSELVLGLPGLHHVDTDGVDGHIALAKMRLPARLRVVEGRAELVALVTGLAGQLAISAEFGPGPLRPTGLSLQVSGTGAMSVIRTPPPAPKPPAAKPTAPTAAPKPQSAPVATKPRKRRRKRKKVEPPRTGLVADLRRAVPAPLEPVVKRLAAVPAARRLYRRVTR